MSRFTPRLWQHPFYPLRQRIQLFIFYTYTISCVWPVCDLLISLSIISSKFMHIVKQRQAFLLLKATAFCCVDHTVFISAGGRWYFLCLTWVDDVAINKPWQMSDALTQSLSDTCPAAGALGHMVRCLHSASYSGCRTSSGFCLSPTPLSSFSSQPS